jgi:hypothetical protein
MIHRTRRRTRGYSEEQLIKAIKLCLPPHSYSASDAAAELKITEGAEIPVRTIEAGTVNRRDLHGGNPVGAPPKLPDDDLRAIIEWCLKLDSCNLAATKLDVLVMASKIAERRGTMFQTATGLPSQSWWTRFSEFSADHIHLRPARSISREQSAAATDPATIAAWFHRFVWLCESYGIPPENVLAADETMFGKIKELAKVLTAAEKEATALLTDDKFTEHITLLLAVTLAGEFTTPLFIFEVDAVVHPCGFTVCMQGASMDNNYLDGTLPGTCMSSSSRIG